MTAAESEAARVWGALREEDRALLVRLAALAAPARTALVGGAVRDALLGLHPLDLDVVVEAAGGEAAEGTGGVEAVAARSGLDFVHHPRYDNATLHLPDGRALDLVRARAETYPVPGAAPEVRPGTLDEDLARRDFALNALALVLGPDGEVRLLDPFGGRADLAARTLRPLHAGSFRDDASRLARGARLAARLGLDLHPAGRAQVADARRLAPATPRVTLELPLVFAEPRPGRVFGVLRAWGAPDLFGADPGEALARLDARRDAGEAVPAQAYEAAWLAAQPDPAGAAAANHLGEKPLRLLARAREDRVVPDGAPEALVREALGLPAPVPRLAGADLVALGVPPGPRVGQLLARLAARRAAGAPPGPDAERAAVLAWLRQEDGADGADGADGRGAGEGACSAP